MRVDREMTRRLVVLAREDDKISSALKRGDSKRVQDLIVNLVERRQGDFRTRDELLDDEGRKFVTTFPDLPEGSATAAARALKAAIDDPEILEINPVPPISPLGGQTGADGRDVGCVAGKGAGGDSGLCARRGLFRLSPAGGRGLTPRLQKPRDMTRHQIRLQIHPLPAPQVPQIGGLQCVRN